MKAISNFPGHYNWKHVNLQLVSFASGLALATVIVLGGSEILRDRSSSTEGGSLIAPRAERPSPQFDTAAADSQPLNFVYVVGSQSEAEALERAFATEALVDSGVADREVMVIDSPQEEAAVFLASGELAQVGDGSVTLVDLRTPSAPAFNASKEDHGAFSLVQERSHPQVGPAASSETAGNIYASEGALQADVSLPATLAADFFGAGQPGEGTQSVSPMFGTMMDAVYVIEDQMYLR